MSARRFAASRRASGNASDGAVAQVSYEEEVQRGQSPEAEPAKEAAWWDPTGATLHNSEAPLSRNSPSQSGVFSSAVDARVEKFTESIS
ncbi:hypothetical protein AB1L30_00995, partial [Bremerella sp. JC817]|uniref:hypothetical protein n=1 Tax=Bremerella sp. JC817 TaxID=3231756 RepID=UPI00345B316F